MADRISWKGAREVCPVCTITVKLTTTGRFTPHGARDNRCATSGLMSPSAIEAGREANEDRPRRLTVRTYSYEQRTIYTLAFPYLLRASDGRPLWSAAVVVTQESGGKRHARGVGMLGNDSAPREYRLTDESEADVLRQVGAIR